MAIKNFNVSLEEKVVEEARKNLVIGQSLSPVINELLKEWIKKKKPKTEQGEING